MTLDTFSHDLAHMIVLLQFFQRGSTALYLACNRQHTGIALMLLHAGCEMDHVIEVCPFFSNTYGKNPKNLDTRKNCWNYPKILTTWFYYIVRHAKDADGMANSEDHDQTALDSFRTV